MTFNSAYNRPKTEPCPAGNDTIIEKSLRYDARRVPGLVETGKHSQSEYINSFRDECDLKKVIERCVAAGDFSALQASPGVYVDTTSLPSITSALETANAALSYFEKLPVDKRSAFSDFGDFLEKVNTDKNVLTELFPELKPAAPVAPDGGDKE